MTLLALNMFTIGTAPSVFIMSSVHNLAALAPLGKQFKSSVIAPVRKFGYDHIEFGITKTIFSKKLL